MKFALWLLAAGLVLALVYVRVAPSSPADWHKTADVSQIGDTTYARGHVAVRLLNAPRTKALAEIDRIATATPRTTVLARDDARVTYITRSAVFGFPDYTTVEATAFDGQPVLVVHGRARFGGSDVGVNRNRVQRWLQQMTTLAAPT